MFEIVGAGFKVHVSGLSVWGTESEQACPPVSPPSLPALLDLMIGDRGLAVWGLGFKMQSLGFRGSG